MLKSLLLFLQKTFKTNTQLKLENIFPAKQLEIYKRTTLKLKIKRSDRLFFILIKDLLSNWRERLFIVRPATIIKWHRKSFRIYWKRKSKTNGGRPMINREVVDLIKQMANENPLWGVPRIHGELLKLGFEISQSTVQRYFPKRGGRTMVQRWKTFLKNHSKEIISIDFLTIPTVNFKQIYVLVIIEHFRRNLIYFNVTKNPTSEWTTQQLRNLLFEYNPVKYLIRDRDTKYGKLFSETIRHFGIKQILTSYRSPWQNSYVERVIGSIKRECLDHVIVLNESHLRTILTDFGHTSDSTRTHLKVGQYK